MRILAPELLHEVYIYNVNTLACGNVKSLMLI